MGATETSKPGPGSQTAILIVSCIAPIDNPIQLLAARSAYFTQFVTNSLVNSFTTSSASADNAAPRVLSRARRARRGACSVAGSRMSVAIPPEVHDGGPWPVSSSRGGSFTLVPCTTGSGQVARRPSGRPAKSSKAIIALAVLSGIEVVLGKSNPPSCRRTPPLNEPAIPSRLLARCPRGHALERAVAPQNAMAMNEMIFQASSFSQITSCCLLLPSREIP